MVHLPDFIIHERVAVACVKRRDAGCFVRFFLEQVSAPALNTCARLFEEGSDPERKLLLQALVDIHKSVQLIIIIQNHWGRAFDEDNGIIFSKKLRLTKEFMENFVKSSELCGPIRGK